MFDVTIPQLTDEQLLEKYRAIKPLVRDEEDGKLYWIEGKENIEYLRGVAYDWTPKKIREVEKRRTPRSRRIHFRLSPYSHRHL